MRKRLPDFLTLPSSTIFTFKALPISLTFVFLPLNEKEDVRAATFNSAILVNAFSSSSASPSQKNSFSGSALMLTNGNTAIEGVSRSRPVVTFSIGCEPGRAIVAESGSRDVLATKAAPSTRQNFIVSSVSRRLHWGQRFILLGEIHPFQQTSVTRIVAQRSDHRFCLKEHRHPPV